MSFWNQADILRLILCFAGKNWLINHLFQKGTAGLQSLGEKQNSENSEKRGTGIILPG